ncbi:hypothetical protein WISP_95817 [Willisornis vidua]|uniref:Uncharacterized protein n=1 Tax=Willisornis vidua TaxID=1566151 RepID=A0ABQ9CZY0_9PASS|nr:hypothetical protein WISP_95817 [Willisornis vidua]
MHHAPDAMWSKWIALVTQHVRNGSSNRPGILEIITSWPEGGNFSLADDEEEESVSRAEEAPPYNQLPDEETRYALFTNGSCRIVGKSQKWKAAVWSLTRRVAEATKEKAIRKMLLKIEQARKNLELPRKREKQFSSAKQFFLAAFTTVDTATCRKPLRYPFATLPPVPFPYRDAEPLVPVLKEPTEPHQT